MTDAENKLMVTKRAVEGGMIWEAGTDIYTPLFIKWITNENLLHCTGNSTHGNLNKKET